MSTVVRQFFFPLHHESGKQKSHETWMSINKQKAKGLIKLRATQQKDG